MRESVRLEGMLVAEQVSKSTLEPDGPVKPLDFGDIWEGVGDAFIHIRDLRSLVEQCDDANVSDWVVEDLAEEEVTEVPDEASSTFKLSSKHTAPLKSEQSSTKSNAPRKIIQVVSSTPADNAEEEHEFDDYDRDVDEPDLKPFAMPSLPPAHELKDIGDSTTYTPGKKKVKPPVYIPDLCTYLRSHEDAEKLEVGLKEAATLIRRKATWGSELCATAFLISFSGRS